jgi:hypothetical protein
MDAEINIKVSVKEMQWQQTRADDRSQFFEQRMIDELIWNSNRTRCLFCNWFCDFLSSLREIPRITFSVKSKNVSS